MSSVRGHRRSCDPEHRRPGRQASQNCQQHPRDRTPGPHAIILPYIPRLKAPPRAVSSDCPKRTPSCRQEVREDESTKLALRTRAVVGSNGVRRHDLPHYAATVNARNVNVRSREPWPPSATRPHLSTATPAGGGMGLAWREPARPDPSTKDVPLNRTNKKRRRAESNRRTGLCRNSFGVCDGSSEIIVPGHYAWMYSDVRLGSWLMWHHGGIR
jgi:hypothetical protein